MINFRSTLSLLLLFHFFGAPSILAQDHPTKASPFDAIRWSEQQVQVQVGGKWYIPIAIDGVEVEKILEKCRQQWPGQLQKRFAEDLMEAMALLGHEPGGTVTLRLKASAAAKDVVLEGIPNTLGKRQRLQADRNPQPSPMRLSPSWLSKKQVEQEIAIFSAALRDQFAYLHLKGVDLDEAIEQEVHRHYSRGLPTRMPPVDLVMILQRVLMQFGDGHADVRSSNFRLGEGQPFIPFLLGELGGKVIAFRTDRSALLDPQYPYVVSLDGRPIEECIEEWIPFIAAGSPQLIRRRAVGLLREVSIWRRNTGGIGFSDVERKMHRPFAVELVSMDGKKTRTLELNPTDQKPTYGEWPRSESRLLDDNLGYLRLARMDQEAVQEVYRWMPRFRDSDGLIVDVRGNGGGSRAALLALAGFLIGAEESPWVGNFAVYRKSSKFDDDHLANRFMHRLDSDEWTPEQRQAIDRAFANFKPEWQIPNGFSQWHALLLDRTGHPQEFPYTKEVVILSDAGCFSATDIFLGALELHPRVTLMGTASSGGSARSQRFTLPHSWIEVKCASMASFRPNGWLYDGRGIEVDIEVHPDPSYFIEGGRDEALETAAEYLSNPAGN
jgi:hypothetical protein